MNPARYGETYLPGCFSMRTVAVLDIGGNMNWLSAMIHTEIDLRRMYPAEKIRTKPADRRKPSPRVYLSDAAQIVLLALGKETMTSTQVFNRTQVKANVHETSKLLRKMEKAGQVVSNGKNGRNVLWSVK